MNTRGLSGVGLSLFLSWLFLAQTACAAALTDTQVYHTNLLLRLESDRSSVKVGESVLMRYAVRNRGKELIVIESKETPVLDIRVRHPGNDKVLLSWSERNPDLVSHRVEWKPGETKSLELTYLLKEEDYISGLGIFLTGVLSEDSKVVQSAGVTVLMRGP